jgi:alkanesulfonate monooxygenase SsuD/methylene tetrahydromethanopterin reductase-like flavin-dependent oxidoreductase (luciferase family)
VDYGHDLEFGAFISGSPEDASRAVELSVLAEREGLDLVTFQDHPYQPRLLETWTLMSFVAARTNRVRISPNVLNLPLRPPSVMARSVATLDRLSGGRVELGIGAGGFWDAIEGMGGRRLTPGESVAALEEAIDLLRMLWDTGSPGRVDFDGRHYQLHGAARGPAPLHDVGIWIGAYKPRMLSLVGRKADGWLPSLPYLQPGDLAAGNQAIDEAAHGAGRSPAEVRRLLNIAPAAPGSAHPAFEGAPITWVEEMTRMALEDGVGTFILMADDPGLITTYGREVAPAVREAVAAARSRVPAGGADAPGPRSDAPEQPDADAPAAITTSPPAVPEQSEYERLGVTPTPDDGVRRSQHVPWDESARPHRTPSGPEVEYTSRGRLTGKHLIQVHDALRAELVELQDILTQVREGAMTAVAARGALNEMAMRQNDWTVGALCARYCATVTTHHYIEDTSVFPHLAQADPSLAPVVDRLTEEHLVIHDAIAAVDRGLVEHITHPDDGLASISAAMDFLSDALLSHLAYEEQELVEPLARVGFYASQL